MDQSLNARVTNCANALTGINHVGVKSVTFHCEYLDGEGDVGFVNFELHSIYVLDCCQIFTRFDLYFLIVPVMN